MDAIRISLPAIENIQVLVSAEQVLKENCAYSYVVHYEKDLASELAQLCDKYGSDKGEVRPDGHPYPWPSHTYADFMSDRYGHCRGLVSKVFECGLGTNNPALASSMGAAGRPGASLRVWRDYFPNARIFGCDIDKEILFEEDRIRTFHVDQTSKESIVEMWNAIRETDFDLMIDDGLHEFDAGVSLFENSIDRLSIYGNYIIEDVNGIDMLRYRDYFSDKAYRVSYVTLHRPGLPLNDNQLVVIRKS